MDEWPEDLKIVEAIDVTKDDDEIYCMISFCSADAKFVSLEFLRGGAVVDERVEGFGPGLPVAQLISDMEEALREDALRMGATIEIIEIPPPFGREDYERALQAHYGAADGRIDDSRGRPTRRQSRGRFIWRALSGTPTWCHT